MLPLAQPWPRRGRSTGHSDPRGQARPQNRSPSICGHPRPGSEAGPCSWQAREQTRGPETRFWQSAANTDVQEGRGNSLPSPCPRLGQLRLSLLRPHAGPQCAHLTPPLWRTCGSWNQDGGPVRVGSAGAAGTGFLPRTRPPAGLWVPFGKQAGRPQEARQPPAATPGPPSAGFGVCTHR
uniref:Uncharacterized protein n=1 Tax=Myotis myotis TaxID=51298 RepID=A0A7J7R4R2_MYOMY|nr:hypothetical protein mMyoMyo1_010901 [Myotis myotis]